MADAKREKGPWTLLEAVESVIEIVRSGTAPGEAQDDWERVVAAVTAHEDLPDLPGLPAAEVKIVEKAIAKAYRTWSAAQRIAIWNETDAGMTDDDDDDTFTDPSFNGIGFSLQAELLDALLRAAVDAKKSREKKGRKQ